MATVLSVKERLKRQVGALDLVRQKAASVNDLTCSAAVQAAGELGARALNVPVRVHREPDEDLVVVGLSVALLCNGGVGWVLSRQGEHWWSVGGLVVGAAVFACMSSVATVRVLRRLDYHYYAAY